MSKRSSDRAQLAASLVSILVVLVAASAGWLALWLARDQLPEVVVTHWGANGRADGFTPVSRALIENFLVSLVIPLFLAVLGLVMRQGRIMGPMAAATAVFLSGGINGSVLAQRGLSEAQVASFDPVLPLVLAGVGAVIVGLGLGLAFRRRPGGENIAVALDQTAPRLLVDDGVRLAWMGRTRVARPVWVLLGAALLVQVGMAGWMLAAGSTGMAIFMLALSALLALFGATMSANVTIDARGVRARALGVIAYATIPLTSISGATVTTVSPLGDFGGWGLRTGSDGQVGLITAAGPAIRIDRGEQGAFLISLDDAEAATATLNTLVARRGQQNA